MIDRHNIGKVLNLADIIFEIIPEDYQKRYEQKIFDNYMTLKEQFIAYCISNSFIIRNTDDEIIRSVVLYVVDKYINIEENSKEFNLGVFDRLFLIY